MSPARCLQTAFQFGFSLTEVLITLAILGVIVTLTIPPLFMTTGPAQNNTYTQKASDATYALSQAYLQYKLSNPRIPSSFGPYLTYSSIDNSAATVDYIYNHPTVNYTCNDFSGACIRLYNGVVIKYWGIDTLGGLNITNGVPFLIDPDGKVTDGTTNGPGKSILVTLYFDGKLKEISNTRTNSTYWNGAWQVSGPVTTQTAPWFLGFR